MVAERAARNRDDGYWIAAADPAAAEHALTGAEPEWTIRHALLATDGATRPVDRFAVRTWHDLVGTVQQDGPAAWLAQARALEYSDPTTARWPRSKRHDDATLAVVDP